MSRFQPLSPTPGVLPRIAVLDDGARVLLREQAPGDRAALAELFDGLSGRSRHLRFFAAVPAPLPRPFLDALGAVDGRDHAGILALHAGRPVGEARWVRAREDPRSAEIAVTVSDALQGRGLGGALLAALRDHAARSGVERLTFDVLAENRAAIGLFASLGARLRPDGIVASGSLPADPAGVTATRTAPALAA